MEIHVLCQDVTTVADLIVQQLAPGSLNDVFYGIETEAELHVAFAQLALSGVGFYKPNTDADGQALMEFGFKQGVDPNVYTIRWYMTQTRSIQDGVKTPPVYHCILVKRDEDVPVKTDERYGRIVAFDIVNGDRKTRDAIVIWNDGTLERIPHDKLHTDRIPFQLDYYENLIWIVLDSNDGLIYLLMDDAEVEDNSFHISQQDAAYRRKGYYFAYTNETAGPRYKAMKAEKADNGDYFVEFFQRAGRPRVTPASLTERYMLDELCKI